jgi:Ca2+-binding RTX toxin-like protein
MALPAQNLPSQASKTWPLPLHKQRSGIAHFPENTVMKYTGHSGNDNFTGTAQHDVFDLASGGNDTANGEGGADTFLMGAALNPADRINGGAGKDTVRLDGEYANLAFKTTTMVNVEKLVLTGGHDYTLTTADATVAANAALFVNAAGLKAGDSLTFNGGAETNGSFNIVGGAGHDLLTGGALSDTFDLSHGGNDTARGGGGDDSFTMGAAFTAGDRIDGGTGDFNTIFLDGDYSAGLLLKAHMIQNISDIQVQGDHDYKISLDGSSLAAGQQLQVFDNTTSTSDLLNINAAALTVGSIFVVGGAGRDTIVGGHGSDVLQGDKGADHLTGGGGADIYFYGDASDSTGPHFDTITGFDFNNSDQFVSPENITGVETTVMGGLLRSGTHFNSDLADAIGAGQLGAHHAVLFQPDSGTYQGDTFLIVDFNGHAGYQANRDVVVLLDHAAHLGAISTADFIFDN